LLGERGKEEEEKKEKRREGKNTNDLTLCGIARKTVAGGKKRKIQMKIRG